MNALLSRPRKGRLVLALVFAIALGTCVSSGASATTPQGGSDTIPTGCPLATSSASIGGDAPGSLSGPAVTSLTGGAARRAFSLDSGSLVVDPPLPGDQPAVSADNAQCTALASLEPNNSPLVLAASSGIAVGYGRVTVGPGLENTIVGDPINDTPGDVSPTVPFPPVYLNRLAWVVVFEYIEIASCPDQLALPSTHPTTTEPIPYYHYLVYLLDAKTGTDGLIYTEGGSGPCGPEGHLDPTVTAPVEQFSVPWKLVSRDPDHYSGVISAEVLACDGYFGSVLVDRGTSEVEVIVQRPVTPVCDEQKKVTLQLRAATVMSNLPSSLVHGATGPFYGEIGRAITTPAPSTATPPTTDIAANPTELSNDQNGKTISVKVGTVLDLAVLPDQATGSSLSGPSIANSTDTAVLGPLLGKNVGPVAAFRAWKPGKAEIAVTKAACLKSSLTAGGGKCPWVLHVVVKR